ncbi:TlpA family protein disulfide reductase [Chryseobacterium echinoideorum]|uniref:TlpA family protein disulfide reductase n=1 Tax=Chryseobacterium echinoideorum TaxID=1549648 RepID=UPI0011860A4E|nr:TlpA disulfide reductase family protein [Chryseobacterium echinoideorum]
MFRLNYLLLLIIYSQFPNFCHSQNKIETSEINLNRNKEEAIIFAKLASNKKEIAIITQDKYLNPVTVKLKNGDSLILNTNSTNIIKIFSPVKSFPIEPGDRIQIVLNENNSVNLNDLNNSKEKQQNLNIFSSYDDWYQENYNSDVKMMREKAFNVPNKNVDSIKKFNRVFFNDLKIQFLDQYERDVKISSDVKEQFLSFYYAYNLFWNFENIVKTFPKNEDEKYKAWRDIAHFTNKNTNVITLNLLSISTNKLFDIDHSKTVPDNVIEKLNLHLNPDIRDLLLYRLILSINNASAFKTYLDKFNSFSSNDYFKKLLKEKYENLLLVKKSPKTLVQTINGQNTSIEDIINENRGKYILFNFWASWCSPCIKELRVLVPESRKLNSDEIVLVYISIDTEKNAWINAAKNLELDKLSSSYLLLSDKGPYIQKNRIQSYPTNIIYNKEGKIIKMKVGEITIEEVKNICGLD